MLILNHQKFCQEQMQEESNSVFSYLYLCSIQNANTSEMASYFSYLSIYPDNFCFIFIFLWVFSGRNSILSVVLHDLKPLSHL